MRHACIMKQFQTLPEECFGISFFYAVKRHINNLENVETVKNKLLEIGKSQ